jgi:alkanesulfonate monooxygenase SsuD/methylene tetrahydromethanopterin reductase-like flavin-dependent oxidoreductase (luciferase family)
LGLAWFEQEHKAYGWEFPSVSDRYALLEDALQLLPVIWGPGNKPWHGKVLDIPETACYPRPLQDPLPILLGGSGKRTLRLAARYADAANIFGDADKVRELSTYLTAHTPPNRETPRLTHLSTTLIGKNHHHVNELVDQHRPRNQDPAKYATKVNAGTIPDHIGRLRALADAGATEVMLSLPNLDDDLAPLDQAADVIAAFR